MPPQQEKPETAKTKKLALFFLGGAILFALFGLVNISPSTYAAEEEDPLAYIGGAKWVNECLKMHPEILWLVDADVRYVEKERVVPGISYSKQLFGKQFIEFDRTMMAIYCLRLILDGSPQAYQDFTATQPEKEKLSVESFRALRKQAENLLYSHWEGLSPSQIAKAMEAALVLGAMGKSAEARKIFKPYGVMASDLGDFYREAIRCLEKKPSLCSSFAALSPTAQKLLAVTSRASDFNHMTHLEGNVAMFRRLKENPLCYWALSFAFLVHTCDVAGALGDVNNESSLAYTESTHKTMQVAQEALFLLLNPEKTERDAHHFLLANRSQLNADSLDQSG